MNELSTGTIRELLDYNPNTGIFTWRIRGREWFTRRQEWKRWNVRFAGKAAGCVQINSRGYPALRIRVLDNLYLASRLAFLWMGEPLPEQVDHDDGDSLNQAWHNLKPSNNAENPKNCSMSRANTSGVTGVGWDKARGKWQAQVTLNRRRKTLGRFSDLGEAAAVVDKFRAASGFSERHGKELAGYMA